MTRRRIAVTALSATCAVALVAVVRIATADGGGRRSAAPEAVTAGRAPRDVARAERARQAPVAKSADILLLPADKTRILLIVPRLGRFTARCPGSNRLTTTFVSKSGATAQLVVDDGRSRLRAAFVDSGRRVRLRAAGRVTMQRWQFAQISEGYHSVAVVSIASSPARAIGNPGCAVSAYALGPTRRQRTRVG
jgi:hypothetical protein